MSTFQAKTMCSVYFVRHAQAEHNLAADVYPVGSQERSTIYQSPEYFNAKLTPEGELQASTCLVERFNSVDNVRTVYVSTLLRTLQTAHLGLRKFRQPTSDTVWFASDLIREYSNGSDQCDKRGSIQETKKEFPYIDFSDVTEHDPIELEVWEEATDVRIIGEFLKVLAKLKIQQECKVGDVIMISHDNYLCRFFRIVLNEEKNFENCEVVAKKLNEVLQKARENGFELD